MPAEIRAAWQRVLAADYPMPAEDAPEDEWDAWSDLQLLLSVLAGWPDKNPDRWLSCFDDALALPGVQALLGDAVEEVQRLGRWIAETTPAPRTIARSHARPESSVGPTTGAGSGVTRRVAGGVVNQDRLPGQAHAPRRGSRHTPESGSSRSLLGHAPEAGSSPLSGRPHPGNGGVLLPGRMRPEAGSSRCLAGYAAR